jgi:Domain of unknown function (DUF4394)/PEP-CTERM motif
VPGATASTLYALNGGNETIATVAPPESGTLHTAGPLGVSTAFGAGFDISGLSGTAYIAANRSFYAVNLQTGSATSLGVVGIGPNESALGIAAPVGTQTPEPGTILLLSIGLTVGIVLPKRLR